MDGIHDMGGTQGWGTVVIDPDEPVFAEPWEAQGVRLRGSLRPPLGHQPRRDAPRHRSPAPPRLPRRRLLRPVAGLRGDDAGRQRRARARCGRGSRPPVAGRGRRGAGRSDARTSPTTSPRRPAPSVQIDDPARFAVGQRRPRARSGRRAVTPACPATSAGTTGTVIALLPSQVLPDTHAHFIAENAQYVYAVAFDSRELWGAGRRALRPHHHLYESYLEPA